MTATGPGDGAIVARASGAAANEAPPSGTLYLRGTGIVALAALYPARRWPEVAGCSATLGVTIFLDGPWPHPPRWPTRSS